MNRKTIRAKRYDRMQLLRDWLSFQDAPTDPRNSPVIQNEVNYTEDNAKTEFFWRTVNPLDVIKDNQVLDQESINSDDYAEKDQNGQGLVSR